MKHSHLLILSLSLCVGFFTLAKAQSVDEQLLYSQNAYQQAFSKQTRANSELENAQSELKNAQDRLANAQKNLQTAQAKFDSARAEQDLANKIMQTATDNLRQAWKRKDSK